MFEMDPEMDFGERLSLWWSCYWRQIVCTAICVVPVFIVFALVLVPWIRLGHHHLSRAGIVEVTALSELLGLLAAIPANGDGVRRGFIAQDLTAPRRIDFWSATMLGLTTFGWGFLAGLPGMLVTEPIHKIGHPLMGIVISFIVSIPLMMYIVLPRQARRLRLQCGYDE
jgi:hypothetical protein